MALTATKFNQGAVPTNDRDISALTSFKPLQFVAPLHGTVAATVITTAPFNFIDDTSATQIVDTAVGPGLQAAGVGQTKPLEIVTGVFTNDSPPVRLLTGLRTRVKQITLSCATGFAAARKATLVVSKVSNATGSIVVTPLNATSGTPAVNVLGETAATPGTLFSTNDNIIVIPLSLSLTDADVTLERGDFFRVEWSSVSGTPGATGLTVTITAITESIVDQPSAVS